RELFPGLIEKLVAAGAAEVDPLADGLWYIDGRRFVSAPSGLQGIGVTRPVLEHEIRQRVRQLPDVRIDAPCHVVALTSSPDRSAVTGVRVRRGGDETDRSEEALAADLVVDCSGRGSRTPQWLAELGYPRPEEDRIAVDVGYASCMFRLPADVLGHYLGVVVSATSTNPRAGVLVRIEDGRWQVSLAGFAGLHPPVTPDRVLRFP